MKQGKHFFYLAAMLLATLTGCQEIEGTDITGNAAVNDEVELVASMEDAASRTLLSEDNQVMWVKNDKLAIFYGYDSPSEFTLKKGEGTTQGTFRTPNVSTAGKSIGDAVVAIYPYIANAKLTYNDEEGTYSVKTRFPAEQHYSSNSFGSGAAPMMAISEKGSDLSFKNVGATIKMRVKSQVEGAVITKIVAYTTERDGQRRKLAGEAIYTMRADGVPTVELVDNENAVSEIVLICDGGVELSTTEVTEFYFSLPPMVGDNKFEAEELVFELFENDRVSCTIFKEVAFGCDRSVITTIGEEEGYTYVPVEKEVDEAVSYVWTSSTVASTSVEGEGTEESPYLIHSANDLQWMIDQVNNPIVLPVAIDDVEQLPYYQLTHDLEIDSEEGATWTPIGTETNPFVGYFDGCSYTISGEMHTTTNIVGFFGYNAGAISNLKNTADVKDCRTLTPMSSDFSAIGSIAGYSTGKIIKCENSGNVTAADILTTTYTGGICGYQCVKEEADAFINECKNSGAVAGVDGTDNATGGIVAICSADKSFSSIVCASENTGSVTNGIYVGGICGYANYPSCLVACRNLGEVEHSDDAYGGGIVGYFSAKYGSMGIAGCYTTIGGVSGYEEEDQNRASYTFDEGNEYYVNLNEPDWVDEIIGPWDNPDNHDAEYEMNYVIVQYNYWLGYWGGNVCNWHWERGENNLPILVAGEPEGEIGG